MLTDSEILAIARRETDDALGYDADILASKREKALDYYHGKMKAPAEGRSGIVSKDVADTMHALLSQTAAIFQTSIVRFDPQSEDDESQAQLESDYCRKQFDKSNGWKLLNESTFDALLIGNGWLKIHVEPTTQVKTEHYGDLDEWQLQGVTKPISENQTVSVIPRKDGYSVRREDTSYRLVVECIQPEQMLFASQGGQFDLKDLRFVGERKLFTVNQLLKMGVELDDAKKIPDSEDDYWPATRAREGIYQDETGNEQATQTAERLKECFDVHIRLDMNDDGNSELRRVIFGGNVLIENEPADWIPYCTGSPIPLPHRVQGTGIYEQMASIQDAKTDTLRAYLDNLKVMNGSRLGVLEGEVNMKDATAGRLNGLIRMKRPDAIFPIPATDAGQQAIMGLNYMDTVRSQRGGSSVDQNDADKQLMASSAAAATGMQESAERTAGWYAHNLVNTLLKGAYELIHRTLRVDMPGTVTANLRGKWVETDPAQWPDRSGTCEITAGLTSSERRAKIQGLNTIIGQQKELLASGGDGVITSYKKLYEGMADWIRASDVGTPEEYLVDPESEQAQQTITQRAQQNQQQQQQIEQQQQQIASMQKAIEDAKIQYDYYKTDQELKFKYYDANMDAEIKEAEMTVDAATKINGTGNEQRSNESA